MSYNPEQINVAITKVLNTLIASDAIQGLTFKTFSDCDKDSTLNDIEFCNGLTIVEDYEDRTLTDACIETCNVAKDAAFGVCDVARETCKVGCDALYASNVACKEACDVARQACKAGCLGLCDDECNDMSHDCKNGCDDAFPYNDCNDECNRISAECKSGAQSVFDDCASGCETLTIRGGVEAGLDRVNGAGGIRITSVDSIRGRANRETGHMEYSINLTCNIPSIDAHGHWKVWQEPLPAISGTDTIIANDIKASMGGVLVQYCDGNSEGKTPGYYFNIHTLTILIPENVSDSSGLLEAVEQFGMGVSIVTDTKVDLNKMIFDWVNSFLSNILIDTLNGLLNDISILSPDC